MPPISVPRPSARRPLVSACWSILRVGHLAEREEHAGRFDHHDDHHQAHGD
jgi:hypothetical protein